jgi:hypothetical protein
MTSRTVRKEIPWIDGTIGVEIRVWSMRERDMHERKFNLPGESLVGGLIAALADPKVNASKSIQIIRTMVDDQRKRLDSQGAEASYDKLSIVLVRVELPGQDPLVNDGTEAFRDQLANLDADIFDVILKAADEALYLRPEEKKISEKPGPGKP